MVLVPGIFFASVEKTRGQGQVFFLTPLNTIYNEVTGVILPTNGIYADLYWAPWGGEDETLFQPLGTPTLVTYPGLVIHFPFVTVPVTPPGAPANFQVRAWEQDYGATYEEALANTNLLKGRLALTGKSEIITLDTADPQANPREPPPFVDVSPFWVTARQQTNQGFSLQPPRAACAGGLEVQEMTMVTDLPRVSGNGLGQTVAVSGNWAVVGDPYKDFAITNSSGGTVTYNNVGQVRIYRRISVEEWVLHQTFSPPPSYATASWLFGTAVAMDGHRIVVGAPGGAGTSINDGLAMVLAFDGAAWQAEATLIGDNALGTVSQFGQAVAIAGDHLVVGAPNSSPGNLTGAGIAWVFDRVETNGTVQWARHHPLRAWDSSFGDHFGQAVALAGEHLVVGVKDDIDAGPTYGSAYLFKRNTAGEWTFNPEKLFAPDGTNRIGFGTSVVISEGVLAIGAPFADGALPQCGAVYVWRYYPLFDRWVYEQKLTAADGRQSDSFGRALALDEGRLAIGALAAYAEYPQRRSGKVWLFTYDAPDEVWEERMTLVADSAQDSDHFGESVALDGNNLAVLATYADQNPTDPLTINENSGATYLYNVLCLDCFPSPGVFAPQAGLEGTTAAMALDGRVETVFKSSIDDWQSIQVDWGCTRVFTGLRRYMSRDGAATSGDRDRQGEAVAYSADGVFWVNLTANDSRGWEGYTNYGNRAQAWHSVTYGWSEWLRPRTNVVARFVRFLWDGNGDVLHDIEIDQHDFLGQDTDGDGITDALELAHPCLNWLVRDAEFDPDEDGLTTGEELLTAFPTNPCEPDTDGDGVWDAADICRHHANPRQEDLDGDGIGDLCDWDSDGDGCPDLLDPNPLDLEHPDTGCLSGSSDPGLTATGRIKEPADRRLEDPRWALLLDGWRPLGPNSCGGAGCPPPSVKLLNEQRQVVRSYPSDLYGFGQGSGFAMEAVVLPDRDQDGWPEVAIGVPEAGQGVGAVVIVSGNSGEEWHRIIGATAGSHLGSALTLLDSSHLAMGAPGSTEVPGTVLVIRLTDPGFAPRGWFSPGQPGDQFGTAIVGLAGTADWVAGAPGAEGGRGAIYRLKGSSRVEVIGRGPSPASRFGAAICAGGDPDQDGIPELLVGAPGPTRPPLLQRYSAIEPAAGEETSLPPSGQVTLISATGNIHWTVSGDQPYDRLGAALSALWGEAEGVAAWLVGAPGRNQDAGRFYILASSGETILTFDGAIPGHELGASVAAGPDFNHDGFPSFGITELQVPVPDEGVGRGTYFEVPAVSRLEGVALKPQGGIELGVRGLPGITYRVFVSSDLVEWQEWNRVTTKWLLTPLEDTTDLKFTPQRFYRALSVPAGHATP